MVLKPLEKRLSHNVFLTTFFSQRFSHNVFLTMFFSQRLSNSAGVHLSGRTVAYATVVSSARVSLKVTLALERMSF